MYFGFQMSSRIAFLGRVFGNIENDRDPARLILMYIAILSLGVLSTIDTLEDDMRM